MNIQGTSITTSRLGLGTHSLHRLLAPAARRDLLARALDLGVLHFDTAPSYGDGLAEREIGRMAHTRRASLVLTTKFGIPTPGLGGRIPGWNHVAMTARALGRMTGRTSRSAFTRDYTAQQARKSLEGSLRALRTDYVDILFLHEPTMARLDEPESLVRTLEELKASGKVRAIGLSGGPADCQAIAAAHPALAQVLQVQLPAAADGLPQEGFQPPAAAAISFWEFPAGSRETAPGRLRQTLEGLRKAAPAGVLLVSTNSALQLRESVAILSKSDCDARSSAKSSLA